MTLKFPSPIQVRDLTKRYPLSWARVVSDLLSPPVVMGTLAFLVAFHTAPSMHKALLWITIYISLVCILPLTYIALMVKLGRISDMHMAVRRQRYLPLVIAIICNVLAYIILSGLKAEVTMRHFALFTLTQILLMALITLSWQISIHMISVSGATIGVAVWFGVIPAIMMIPLIPLVAAARLNLKRHTPSQVLAGFIVGTVAPAILLIWIT